MPADDTPATLDLGNPYVDSVSPISSPTPSVSDAKPLSSQLAESSISNLQLLGILPPVGANISGIAAAQPNTPTPLSAPGDTKSSVPLGGLNPLSPATSLGVNPQPTTTQPSPNTSPAESSKPGVGVGQGLGTKPLNNLAIGDTGGANAELNSSLNQSLGATNQAVTDKVLGDSAKADKILGVSTSYVDNLTKLDTHHNTARAQIEKESAAETAAWMQDRDHIAKQEPSPGHWWHNQSAFSKALWLIGLGLGAASQTYGGKNVAAELIMSNIHDDISAQRETKKELLETNKFRGVELDKKHARLLADESDDHTLSVNRLNSLLNATITRAQSASTADLKAAYSNSIAVIAEEKVKIAQKRFESTRSEKLNIVDQNFESARNNARIANESNQKELDRQHQTGEKVLDRQLSRDLAEEKIQAQIDKANKGKGGDLHEIPSQSGISIRIPGKNGQPDQVGNLAVPKDMAKDAHNIISNGQAKVQALTALKEHIERNGLPYGGFSNDNEGRQRLAAIADPIIKQLGGRFSPDNVGLTRELVIGEDPSSIWQRIKGGSKEDIVKLLDQEIKESPGSTKQSLLSLPGINLAQYPDADLVFTTPDSRGPKDRELTNDEKVEQATGTGSKQIKLESPKDIKEFGAEAEQAMPAQLKAIVADTKTKLAGGFDKEDISTIRGKALNAIDRWSEAHPGSDIQKSNAYTLIRESHDKAQDNADILPRIKAMLLVHNGKVFNKDDATITKDEVTQELTKAGIVLPTNKILDLVRELRDKQIVKGK